MEACYDAIDLNVTYDADDAANDTPSDRAGMLQL